MTENKTCVSTIRLGLSSLQAEPPLLVFHDCFQLLPTVTAAPAPDQLRDQLRWASHCQLIIASENCVWLYSQTNTRVWPLLSLLGSWWCRGPPRPTLRWSFLLLRIPRHCLTPSDPPEVWKEAPTLTQCIVSHDNHEHNERARAALCNTTIQNVCFNFGWPTAKLQEVICALIPSPDDGQQFQAYDDVNQEQRSGSMNQDGRPLARAATVNSFSRFRLNVTSAESSESLQTEGEQVPARSGSEVPAAMTTGHLCVSRCVYKLFWHDDTDSSTNRFFFFLQTLRNNF